MKEDKHNREKTISIEEYNKHIDMLKFIDTTRNTLLTFAFTSVLAVVGIAIGTEKEKFNPWLCLLPFFLIIPFTARISYYRLSSAHINSFLEVFAEDKMCFMKGTKDVPERYGRVYKVTAFLVNHEMLCLSIAVFVAFGITMWESEEKWKIYEFLLTLIVPLVLCFIVFLISFSTYNYKKMLEYYGDRWEKYYKKFCEECEEIERK